MIKSLTIISSGKFASDIYIRSAFYACAFKAEGVRTLFINNAKHGKVRAFFYSFIRFFKLIFGANTVFAFNPDKYLNLALKIKKIFGTKIIVDIWEPLPYFTKKTRAGKSILKNAIKITYSNENIGILLKTFYPDLVDDKKVYRLQTGGNGLELLNKNNEIQCLNKSRGLPEIDIKDSFKKFITYIGDLTNLKALDEILITFSIIADRADDVKFILVSSGTKKQIKYIKNAVKKLDLTHKLELTGPLYPNDIRLRLLKADIIVDYLGTDKSDYLKERIYVREAVNLEKPVICSNGGELPYFISYTYQSPCDNIEVVNNIVKLAVEGTDKRESDGRAYIQNNLNYKGIVNSFIKEILN